MPSHIDDMDYYDAALRRSAFGQWRATVNSEHEVRRLRQDMVRDQDVEMFMESGSRIEITPEGAPRRHGPWGDMPRMVRRELREHGAALDASTSPSQAPAEVDSDASSPDVRVEEAEPPSAVRLSIIPATGTAPAAVGPASTMDLSQRSRSPQDQYRRPQFHARPAITPAGSAPPQTPFILNTSDPFVAREQLLVHELASGRSGSMGTRCIR